MNFCQEKDNHTIYKIGVYRNVATVALGSLTLWCTIDDIHHNHGNELPLKIPKQPSSTGKIPIDSQKISLPQWQPWFLVALYYG